MFFRTFDVTEHQCCGKMVCIALAAARHVSLCASDLPRALRHCMQRKTSLDMRGWAILTWPTRCVPVWHNENDGCICVKLCHFNRVRLDMPTCKIEGNSDIVSTRTFASQQESLRAPQWIESHVKNNLSKESMTDVCMLWGGRMDFQ